MSFKRSSLPVMVGQMRSFCLRRISRVSGVAYRIADSLSGVKCGFARSVARCDTKWQWMSTVRLLLPRRTVRFAPRSVAGAWTACGKQR